MPQSAAHVAASIASKAYTHFFCGTRMNEITLRAAGARDIPEIQRLYRQLDRHHAELLPGIFRPVDGDARGNDVVQKWIERDDADYLLAELDGEVVGFINLQRSNHPKYPMFRPHDFALIENAMVDKPCRGKGIGKALLAAAIEWARGRDLRHVQTTVWHGNAGAREFYLHQGFSPMTVRLELDTEANEEPAAPRRV